MRTQFTGTFLDTAQSQRIPRCAHRGFSFVELLFAVMILGIGFIMIAAIFPVGIGQIKSNFDETKAAVLVRTMALSLTHAKAADYTGIGIQPMVSSAALDQIARANSISPADPRYAIVPLYQPPVDAGTAQLFLFVVNRSEPFTASDFSDMGGGVRSLEPRAVQFRIVEGQIRFVASPGSDEETNLQALAPGGFVLIASTPGLGLDDRERLQGTVYRLGSAIDRVQHLYDFMPGNAFIPDPTDPDGSGPREQITSIGYTGSDWRTAGVKLSGSIADGTAYIIGRNRTTRSTFDGPAMDVAYYTTIVRSAR